ncbi:MAG: DinB family protein [Phycisphaerales bacterium]
MNAAAIKSIVDRLARHTRAIAAVLDGVDDVEAHYKPTQVDWSIVEIVNHLVDEETEDFRTRIEMTLRDPTTNWPPIDPKAAVVERNYQQRDLQTSLQNFRSLREGTVAWLRMQFDADWASSYEHPVLGRIRAGDLLVSLAAHDLLHVRQIARRRYEYLNTISAPYVTAYAGQR